MSLPVLARINEVIIPTKHLIILHSILKCSPPRPQVLIHPWLVCCALLLQDTGQVVSYRQNTPAPAHHSPPAPQSHKILPMINCYLRQLSDNFVCRAAAAPCHEQLSSEGCLIPHYLVLARLDDIKIMDLHWFWIKFPSFIWIMAIAPQSFHRAVFAFKLCK